MDRANIGGDLERDRHKVCIARKPEQRTQSLRCLDGLTQSPIRCGRCCPALGRSAEEERVASCWLLLCDLMPNIAWPNFFSEVFIVQRSPPTYFALHLVKSWKRLWVVHTRQSDFESVVLFSHTTPLNQTLSRSTSLPYIPRHRYLQDSSRVIATFIHQDPSSPLEPSPHFSTLREFVILCQYWLSLISRRFCFCPTFLWISMFSFAPVCSFLSYAMF